MKNKNKDRIYTYLISILMVVNYLSLWFVQVEVFLWISLTIGLFWIAGLLLKVERSAYVKTALSLKALGFIGIMIIIKKVLKYILISGNVLDLISDDKVKELLISIKDIGGIVVLLLIFILLVIINTLMTIGHSIVYEVKLCKDNKITKTKCVTNCILQVIPIINWVILIMCIHNFEKDKS